MSKNSNKTKIIISCVCGVVLGVFLLAALVNNFIKKPLNYNVSEYDYESMEDVLYVDTVMKTDIYAYYKKEFGMSEKDISDLQRNPNKYYLITFYGSLANDNSCTVYYWKVFDKTRVSDNKNWVLKKEISESGTEINSGESSYATIQVVIKCEKDKIEGLCEEIIREQPFGASGFRFLG